MFDRVFRSLPQRKISDELTSAELEHLNHQLAAEHHQALADMYLKRMAWLREMRPSGELPRDATRPSQLVKKV